MPGGFGAGFDISFGIGNIYKSAILTINMGAAATRKLTMPIDMSIEMGMVGTEVTTNLYWVIIPDGLNWKGVWVSTTTYGVRDCVLYKTTNGNYHAYVSIQTHNTGNIPATSYPYWSRVLQEKWS